MHGNVVTFVIAYFRNPNFSFTNFIVYHPTHTVTNEENHPIYKRPYGH